LPPDFHRLRELSDEYRRMRRLQGLTAQARGQRLNGLVAEVLQAWGIAAFPEVRGSGEVDVAFSIDGRHFVLEAKWEKKRTGTDRIAKLQKRLRQRLAGTTGVLLSQAGYTPDGLRELQQGDRLEMVLMDRTHFEAALSGWMPPAELFQAIMDRAAYQGDAYVSLLKLFPRPPLPEITVGCESEAPAELIRDGGSMLDARIVVTGLPYGASSGAEVADDVLLVTWPDGIAEINVLSGVVRWRVPIAGCHRKPLVQPDGSIFFVRGCGVGRLKTGGGVTIVAGALPGLINLLEGPDEEVWAFANGTPGGGPMLVRLGTDLGEEERYLTEYPYGMGFNAAWISGNRFLICGGIGVSILSLAGAIQPIPLDCANPTSVVRIDDETFLVTAGNTVLLSVNPTNLVCRTIAEMNLIRPSELIAGRQWLYLLAHYPTSSGEHRGAIVRFRLRGA
jgi:hypothetical protein